jgi:hypothetical protein
MTLELWNTFATFGTFIVIAATAIAALVQLRHARGSNQIAALYELQDLSRTPQFTQAEHLMRTELPSKLNDPEFRYQINNRDARTPENQAIISKVSDVGNFYENMGLLVKSGLIDRELALDIWAGQIPGEWRRLAPFTAIVRRDQGNAVYENFEYLLVLAQDWVAAHPNGAYPAAVRRVVLKDEWLEADRQYEASRAPA